MELTHVGEECSFDAILRKHGLGGSALEKLATIVRGADTDRLDLAPQCAGLLAISLGLTKNIADDHALLAQSMIVYETLYAWCEEVASARHAWDEARAC